VDLPGWPEHFEDFMQYIDEESQLQFHTGAARAGKGGTGERAARFHGHPAGDAESERKQRLLEFCRLIDGRVQEVMAAEEVPLILACEQRLASIYREATNYAHVAAGVVAGNPDERKTEELCRDAWETIQPDVEASRKSAISRYEQAAADGLGADNLNDVVLSAHDGRVDTLLVAADHEYWGRFSPQDRHLETHREAQAGDEELLNLATVLSYRQGGKVFTFRQDEMPDDEPAVAVLRY
jgi:hypothetical protein